jgi:CHAT domain
MIQSDQVGTFRITVSGDYKIQATQKPAERDIESCKINRDHLREKTVELLIDMLHSGRLRWSEVELLGEHLYAILLENKIGEALHTAVHDDSLHMDYWRVELEFKPAESVQHPLASWPWEFLYGPARYGWGNGYFLAERFDLVLTRRLITYRQRHTPFTLSSDPVKILFVAPSPKKLDPVEYGSVLETLKTLADQPQNRIKLTMLVDDPDASEREHEYKPQATFSEFSRNVRKIDDPHHIIHFVGHGRNINNEGSQLAFMHNTVRDKVNWVGENDLTRTLLPATALRFVFLQACESTPPTNSYEAVSGLAMRIANQNIPAVVGMQYPTNTLVANKFAAAFYKALVNFKSIDAAMLAGQREIFDEIPDEEKGSSFGWPVLYLRESGSLMAPQTAQPGSGSVADPFKRSAPSAEESLCPWCHRLCDPTDNYCHCPRSVPLRCIKCKERVTKQRPNCGHCGEPLNFKTQQ